jgi:predicted  nucleic acid-binding Zn-ribbon protein
VRFAKQDPHDDTGRRAPLALISEFPGSCFLAYPTAISVKDQYGRTPGDLLEETAEPGPAKEAAMRAFARANYTTIRLADALRKESESKVSSIQTISDNERLASQQIIRRLEQELADTNKKLDQSEEENRRGKDKNRSLNDELKQVHEQLEEANASARARQREFDDLRGQNEVLQQEVEDHDQITKKLRQEFEDESQAQADTIATLRSEVSTAKAMVEALENKLRSKFTNEEYLANAVADLEKELADTKMEHQQIQKKLTDERDGLQGENTRLARSVDELTKKNELLQAKVSHLNKQMSDIMRVHTTFHAEHDRIMDANLRVETELLENMRNERSRIVISMKEQLDLFKAAVKEQESMLEDCHRSEMQLVDQAKGERDRSNEAISKLRRSIQESRHGAADPQRGVQNENTVPSHHSTHKPSKAIPSSRATYQRKSPSPLYSNQSPTNRIDGSIPKESRTPSSTKMSPDEHAFRQGSSPNTTPTAEGKLVHFLNAMAEQGGKHRDASLSRKDDVSSLESSTMIGRHHKRPVRFADKGAPTPQMVGILRRNNNDDDGSSNEDSNIRRSRNSDPRKASNFLSHYNQSEGFDNEDSSKESVLSRNTQYSRLSGGVRHGMIHIQEESVDDESASQYRETVALH